MNEWLYRIAPCLRIVGNAPIKSGWLEPMRYIYEHELVLFEHGDFIVEIEAEKFECPHGSYIIVPPGIRHTSRLISKPKAHRYWVHFDWTYNGLFTDLPLATFCPAKLRNELLHRPPDFMPSQILHGMVPNINTTLDMFLRIENMFNIGSNSNKMVSRGIFLELLLNLLCPENDARSDADAKDKLASKIRRQLDLFADAVPGDAASIQDFLQKSGLSYAHQCRIFKQCYGIPPLQYVTELRITRAKNLLRDTDISVSRIAQMIGFDNLGYFSRIFKKSTGLTAREYRNNSRQRSEGLRVKG